MSEVNVLTITGQVLEIAETRYTPAGIAIDRFLLEHSSRRESNQGPARKAYCRLWVQSTEGLPALEKGMKVRVVGFLSRAGRHSDYRLTLHADLLVVEP